MLEYRSSEMYSAVKALWVFYNKYGNDFVKEYEKTMKKESGDMDKLSPVERINAEKATLHFQKKTRFTFL